MSRMVDATLLWRASDVDVVPVTRQPAMFTRPSIRSIVDSNGTYRAMVSHQPAWGIISGRAQLDMPDDGELVWTCWLPYLSATEELSVLVELSPVWLLTGGIAGGPGILAIGGTGANAADGMIAFDLYRSATTNAITARLSNGTSTTTQDVTLPGAATILTVLAQLRVSGGAHGIYLEVNGQSASSAFNQTIAGRSWRAHEVALNNKGNGGAIGTGRYLTAIIARGRKTLAQIQALR